MNPRAPEAAPEEEISPEIVERRRATAEKVGDVYKLGGTSLKKNKQLGTLAAFFAGRIRETGKIPIIVVSARGSFTDDELARLRALNPDFTSDSPSGARALATGELQSAGEFGVALESHGLKVQVLDGQGLGLQAKGRYDAAEVESVNGDRILDAMHGKDVVVVAGYQGVNENDEVVLLGRGGSDMTAIALAAELQHKLQELGVDRDIPVVFFKDKPGVAMIDPNLVKDTKYFERLPYEVAKTLIEYGYAFLMHRCVKLAEQFGVEIQFKLTPGMPGNPDIQTTIGHYAERKAMEKQPDLIAVGIKGLPKQSKGNENQDLGILDIEFDTASGITPKAVLEIVKDFPDYSRITKGGKTSLRIPYYGDIAAKKSELEAALSGITVNTQEKRSMLTLVATNMGPGTNYCERLEEMFAAAGITGKVEFMTSGNKIHCIIDQKDLAQVALLYADTFGLRKEPDADTMAV